MHLLESELWRLVKGQVNRTSLLLSSDLEAETADDLIGISRPHILFSTKPEHAPMPESMDEEKRMQLIN